MKDNQAIVNGQVAICHELEFVDMDNTLDWLLETAETYNCTDALSLLENARHAIDQQKQILFGEGLLY